MPLITSFPLFVRPIQRVLATGGIGLVLFVTSAFIGALFAYDPRLSWPMLLTLLISVGLFFAIADYVVAPRWIARGLVIITSLLALYFVSQYAHFNYKGEVGLSARLGQITGSLMPDFVFFSPHPNAVASFLVGGFLLGVGRIWRSRGPERLIWGWAVAVIAYGLLISGSRGAWFGLAVALGIWILLHLPGWISQLVGMGLGLIAGFLLSGFIIFHFASPEESIPFFSSLLSAPDSRFTLYQNSLTLWGDYPFTGIGLGDTFTMVYSRYQLLISVPYLYYAHNLFLSVGLGQGIIGIVGLIWALIDFYRFVVRVERTGLNLRSQMIFRGAWLGATATLIHGFTDSVQFSADRWTMLMLFALLGLAVAMGRPALARVNPDEIKGDSKRSRYYGKELRIAAAVAVVLPVFVFWQSLASNWYVNIGSIYQTRAELSPNLDPATRSTAITQAATYFERALSLDPAHSVANRRLGMIALNRRNFEAATTYLERAYRQEPKNQATLKALGYAYLWTGQVDSALELFQQVDFQNRLIEELKFWGEQWQANGHENLSTYAKDMVQRLLAERS